jgi:hypothetical protein
MDSQPKPVVALTPPKREKKDITYEMVKGALGDIPFVGSSVSSIFGELVAKPLESKRDEFFELLASKIVELRMDVEAIRKFVSEPQFSASLVRATNIALETADGDKLLTLRNSVINSVEHHPVEDKRIMFFNTLEDLAPIHIEVLRLFNDPYVFAKQRGDDIKAALRGGSSTTIMITKFFPEYDDDLLLKVISDLNKAGLLRQERTYVTYNSGGTALKLLTRYGQELMDFIAE